jgi:2-polyprenyl-3-methyl-5-hydroxy-6-metoxy-1,4-benzoquinol methylase
VTVRRHGNVQKHESRNPLQRRLIRSFHDQILSCVGLASPSRILEIGCGEGYVLAEIQRARLDTHLIGIDQSEAAIEAAKRRVAPPAELHVGDAREMTSTFEGGRPDLVLMLEVLEHLEDPVKMLDDLAALTSRYVLLSVPREPIFRSMNLLRLKNVRDLGNDPEHVNHWNARAFVDFVNSRFEIVTTRRPFPWTVVLGEIP